MHRIRSVDSEVQKFNYLLAPGSYLFFILPDFPLPIWERARVRENIQDQK